MERRSRAFAELIRGLGGIPFGPWERAVVTGIALDSRRVEPGDLFVAVRGQRADGVRYVPDALRRGAAAVVVPPYAGPVEGTPGLRVGEPRLVLPELAARFHGHPARSLRVVGVTGTNGKTTTVWMIGAILRAAGEDPGLLTTAEAYTGRRRFRPEYTTPEPPDLHLCFREMVDCGLRYACMEVSSHGMVLGRVRGVRFQVGAVTNVSPDHQDFHPTFEHYVAAKRAFVAGLDADAVCLLNAEGPRVRAMAAATPARILLYGLAGGAAVRACDVSCGPSGSRFTVRTAAPLPRLAFEVGIPLPGRHNVLNALAAAGAALALGVPPETVRAALAAFQPPARRLAVRRVGEYAVIDDVAMNEGSCEAVLATVASLRCPQLVVVNALRGNRGPEVNAGIARVLARWNRRLGFAPLILTASQSHVARYAVDHRVRPEEASAFPDAARREGLDVSFHEELPPALEEGAARLRPGGVLLLLGTFGMDEGAALAADCLRRR